MKFLQSLCTSLCLATTLGHAAPATPNTEPPSPLSIKTREQIHSAKTTEEEHQQLIEDSFKTHTSEYLVMAYDRERKLRKTDTVLQTAFGYAFFRLLKPGYKTPNAKLFQKLNFELWRPAMDSLESSTQGGGAKLPFCWYTLGYAKIASDFNIEDGKKCLEKALTLNPNYYRARIELASAFLRLNGHEDPQRALAEARKAETIKPTSTSVYWQGAAYFAMKKYKMAYPLIKKAKALSPSNIPDSLVELYRKMAGG